MADYNADDFEQISSDLWKLIKMKVNQKTRGPDSFELLSASHCIFPCLFYSKLNTCFEN